MTVFLSAWTSLLGLTLLCHSSTAIFANCSSGKLTFVRRQFIGLETEQLARMVHVHESPPSKCFGICREDRNCSAFFVNYRNHSCVLVLNVDSETLGKFLIPEGSSSYHRKICLPDTLCSHEWDFDEIHGVQLFHYHDKTLPNITTAAECMSACVSEPTFTCRSARLEKQECVLSRHDRRTASEVFRQSPKGHAVVYLERQCIEEPRGCLFRSRQSRSTLRHHRHVQVAREATTRGACEEACLQHAPFACRSYQFSEEGPPLCLLSPEDSTSEFRTEVLPMESGEAAAGSYFEKESCVEVDVKCEASVMKAVVRVSTPFRGRVYAAGHPYDCYSVSIASDGKVTLSLPLHGRNCGTKNLGNGTFVNSVVVQHHPFVLRTTDRRIDVACDYEEMRLKIRGAKGVKQGELEPLAHTVSAVAPTPPIRLRVVNATDQDVSGAELGDPLFLKVELTDESVYGIFGSDLVARSNGGSETVLLLNDDGCSVEPSVMQTLDRLPGSKSLVAPFQAFKFASDSAVKFQMTVSYCLDTCPPADCDAPSSSQSQSYGRRRRKRATPSFDLQPGDLVVDVEAESPTFFVNSLGSTLDAQKPGFGPRWELPLQFHQPSEGHIRVKAQTHGFCVSITTLYTTGAAIGAIQLAIICACAVLFFRHSEVRFGGKKDAKSWPSISSRRKLVCNPS